MLCKFFGDIRHDALNYVLAQKFLPTALGTMTISRLWPTDQIFEETFDLLKGQQVELSFIFEIPDSIGEVVRRFDKVRQWMSAPSSRRILEQTHECRRGAGKCQGSLMVACRRRSESVVEMLVCDVGRRGQRRSESDVWGLRTHAERTPAAAARKTVRGEAATLTARGLVAEFEDVTG